MDQVLRRLRYARAEEGDRSARVVRADPRRRGHRPAEGLLLVESGRYEDASSIAIVGSPRSGSGSITDGSPSAAVGQVPPVIL